MPTMVTKMVRCPFCKTRVSVYEQQCSTCEADLSLLSSLHLMSYALFNEGLVCIEKDDMPGALVKLSAAVELGKDFKEGRQLLAKVADTLGLEGLARRQRALIENDTNAAERSAKRQVPPSVQDLQ